MGRSQGLTVKLLLTFLVLDSATLASVRSTSSKMMDCTQKNTKVNVQQTFQGDHTHKCVLSHWSPLRSEHSTKFFLSIWSIVVSTAGMSWSVSSSYPPSAPSDTCMWAQAYTHAQTKHSLFKKQCCQTTKDLIILTTRFLWIHFNESWLNRIQFNSSILSHFSMSKETQERWEGDFLQVGWHPCQYLMECNNVTINAVMHFPYKPFTIV